MSSIPNNPNKQQNLDQVAAELEQAHIKYQQEREQLLDEVSAYNCSSLEEALKVNPIKFATNTRQAEIFSDILERIKDHLEKEKTLFPEELTVREFNKKHAVVKSGQTYILTEEKNALGQDSFTLESRQSFIHFYEDEYITLPSGKRVESAKIWLKSPNRRKYERISFEPINPKPNEYNIWKGFSKESIKGDASKYWNHVYENICNNNEEAYTYLRKWMAYIFQHLDEVHTAIIICGSQGVGKNSFVEPLGVLLGNHYVLLSSLNELISNFNYHLKHAVLIHANEALWGGNRKEIGTLKAMITEKTCLIEGKGKDRIMVKNFKHIILSSNESWPAHLDSDDRRFFVLKAGEAHKEDHEYFKAIQNQLDNRGYEALLYDLLNEDVSNFNPRLLPKCNASFDIKLQSADSATRYIYEALQNGGFNLATNIDHPSTLEEIIEKDKLFLDYQTWCSNSGEQASKKHIFCGILKRLLPSIKVKRLSYDNRPYGFKFENLEKTRNEFATSFKVDPHQIFNDEE